MHLTLILQRTRLGHIPNCSWQVALSRCEALVTKEFSGPMSQIRRLFMNGTAHSIRSISSSVILLLAISADAATVWDGPTISHPKSDYANPLLAENQDRLTATVWITPGTSQGQPRPN